MKQNAEADCAKRSWTWRDYQPQLSCARPGAHRPRRIAKRHFPEPAVVVNERDVADRLNINMPEDDRKYRCQQACGEAPCLHVFEPPRLQDPLRSLTVVSRTNARRGPILNVNVHFVVPVEASSSGLGTRDSRECPIRSSSVDHSATV